MKALPLVDIFPFSEPPPSERDKLLAEISGEDCTPRRYARPQDVFGPLLVSMQDRARTHFESALKADKRYQSATSIPRPLAVPGGSTPQLSTYQQKDIHAHPLLLQQELDRYALPLAEGQLLYHGGDLTQGRVPQPGEDLEYSKPLSTSWSAGAAIWHAHKELLTSPAQGRHLFHVLKVGLAAPVRGYPYAYDREETLSEEFEVLLRPVFRLTCTAVTPAQPGWAFPVVEWTLT